MYPVQLKHFNIDCLEKSLGLFQFFNCKAKLTHSGKILLLTCLKQNMYDNEIIY